jgi:hypothetical protein
MAKIKGIGDSVSPCCKPLACFSCLPRIRFRRILEDDVASDVAIQSRHRCPHPSACNISKRKTQLTESKALEMSNLMKKDRRLALCKALIKLYT